MPKDKSFFDGISEAIANAVKDVREKVVEEPWFGRAVNDREAGSQVEAQEPQHGFGSRTHTVEVTREREQAQDKEIDIDR